MSFDGVALRATMWLRGTPLPSPTPPAPSPQLVGHIMEYTTHSLVKKRRGAGGVECYYCVLPREAMARLVPQDGAAA